LFKTEEISGTEKTLERRSRRGQEVRGDKGESISSEREPHLREKCGLKEGASLAAGEFRSRFVQKL